jgi:hypothetical protein
MSLTEQFMKLKARVDQANTAIDAAVAEGRSDLETKVDEVRQAADNRASELGAQSSESGAASHWHQVQVDWANHVKRMRENADAAKAEFEVGVAEDDADWAEANAYDAIAFAEEAILEAEYATLDAVLLRKKADEVVAARL